MKPEFIPARLRVLAQRLPAQWPEHNETCCDAAAELERLQAIVDKLPKTADGVSMVPEMRVWCEVDGELCECEVLSIAPGLIELEEPPDSGDVIAVTPEQCYSTREAAEAAQIAAAIQQEESQWEEAKELELYMGDDEAAEAKEATMREYNVYVLGYGVWHCHETERIRIEKALPGGKSITVWEDDASELGAELERLREENSQLAAALACREEDEAEEPGDGS